MASKILEIDDIGPTFARSRQRGDAQRMYGHGRVKIERCCVVFD
jgi:hypothetical protein